MADKNLVMHPQRPVSIIEWLGLVTSTIADIKGYQWFDNVISLKDLYASINNDPTFAQTVAAALATKLPAVDFNAANILALLKTVDGLNSGLDADTVRGYDPVNKDGDSMRGYLILHADPTQPMHPATKNYVDNVILGLDVKDSVRIATRGDISLAGLHVIDDIQLNENDRVLVKDQATPNQNGIWIAHAGAWERATDCNSTATIKKGMFVFVEDGTWNKDSGWVLTTDDGIQVGVTNLNFVQFSGAGQIIPGTGLSKNGNTLYLTDTGVTPGTYTMFTVNAQGRITGASSPTTIAGYGIADAYRKDEVDARDQKIVDYMQAHFAITGGGVISWNNSKVKWTNRFIVIPMDKENNVSAYIDIFMPPVGTVIAGLAGCPPVTVDDGGILMSGPAGGWIALYAKHTPGGNASDVTLFVADYSTMVVGGLDSNHLLIAVRNAEEGTLKLCTGHTLRPGDYINYGRPSISTIDGLANELNLRSMKTHTHGLSIYGDATGTATLGESEAYLELTLENTGVNPGTYKRVTVDGKGRVTSADNPSTIADIGITDAVNKNGDTINNYLTVEGPLDANSFNSEGYKLLQVILGNNGMGAINPIAYAVRQGKKLLLDEEFASGLNGYFIYNNSAGSDGVAINRIDMNTAPNKTKKVLEIRHNGNPTSPHYGGVVQRFYSRINGVFIMVFKAKLPVGYHLNYYSNDSGDNTLHYWLSTNVGTGKWETYIRVHICGETGIFNDGGFLAVDGGPAPTAGAHLVWHIAASTIFDLTDLNTGHNSNIDADTVDGIHASQFMRSDTDTTTAGNMTVSKTLIVSKQGTDSIIYFPSQANDPGYIKHIENNNFSEMRFGISDDGIENQDYFTWGWDDGNGWHEGARMSPVGTMTLKDIIMSGKNIRDYFAPSGYGLGNGAKRLPAGYDLNTLLDNGWYDVPNPAYGVAGLDWHKILVICSADKDYVTQLAFSTTNNGNTMYIREKTHGTWCPWVTNWNSGNDGAGSGLDADKFDGIESEDFMRAVGDGTIFKGDFNTLRKPGMYTISEFTGCVNTPPANAYQYGTLVVFKGLKSAGNAVNQMYMSHQNKDIYFRGGWDDDWQPWTRMATMQDLPTTLPANGGNADTIDGYHVSNLALSHITSRDANTLDHSGFYHCDVNVPTEDGESDKSVIHNQFSGPQHQWATQIAISWRSGNMWFRNKESGTWEAWKRVARMEDIPTTLPANGGNSDTVDGLHASQFLRSDADNVTNNRLSAGVIAINNKIELRHNSSENALDIVFI